MESPSSTVRRRAWINSSRQWPTLEETDPQVLACDQVDDAHTSIADDDVFSDGCCTGKIESWLLGCGLEACSENSSHLAEPPLKASPSFEDNLSLGADASALNVGDVGSEKGRFPLLPPPTKPRNRGASTSTPRQRLGLPSLNLGYSMTSSCLSSSTCKTASSVSEVLQLCSEDPEETLYHLGFGCDEPQVTARIPTRFFTFPSELQGINFRLFLESQLQRIRDEDPSLSLASRFRQVEVLTAMANAFYSLYSHVSRTPLQKLPAPEFNLSLSPTDKIRRFMGSVRSEPRSPVERLKDTVSKMCLYTGSTRGSDSTSPQPSPRKGSSLPDVVGFVLENAKSAASKKLELKGDNGTNSTVDVSPTRDSDAVCENGLDEQRQETATDVGTVLDGNTVSGKELEYSQQRDMVEADGDTVKPTDLDSDRNPNLRTSLSSSLSSQTVTETDGRHVSNELELDSQLTPGLTCDVVENRTHADLMPVAKVTYDVICPQIVESVNQAPFYCHQMHCVDSKGSRHVSSEKGNSLDGLNSGSRKPHRLKGQLASNNCRTLAAFPKAEEDHCSNIQEAGQVGSPASLPLLGSNSPCLITVTGEDVTSGSSSTPDSINGSSTPTGQISQQSLGHGKGRYLGSLTHQALGQVNNNLQQANSFELEEVHSAGEEDLGQSETTRQMTSPLSTRHQHKGLAVRGDSMQSDSSGYAEEEANVSSDRHGS